VSTGVEFVDAGSAIPFGTGTYSITDGTNTVDFRIQTDEIRDALVAQVGSNFPSGPVDITGVLTQFTFGAADEGFQIIPLTTTPAPASLALLGLGGLVASRRRR